MKRIFFLLLILLPLSAAALPMLSLKTPVARVDKTPLAVSDIAGMRVYCGTQPANYTLQQFFMGATLPDTIVDISALLSTSGDFYCVATTIDIDGRESSYSDEFVVSVKSPPMPPIGPQKPVIVVIKPK